MQHNTRRLLNLNFGSSTPELAQGLAMAFAAALLGSQISAQLFMKTKMMFMPVPVTLTSSQLILNSLNQQYSWISNTGFVKTESTKPLYLTQTETLPPPQKAATPQMAAQSLSRGSFFKANKKSKNFSRPQVKPEVNLPQASVEFTSANMSIDFAGATFGKSATEQKQTSLALRQLRLSIQQARTAFLSGRDDYSRAAVTAAFDLKFKVSQGLVVSESSPPVGPTVIALPSLKIDLIKFVSSRTYFPSKAFTKSKTIYQKANPKLQTIAKNAEAPRSVGITQPQIALAAASIERSAKGSPTQVMIAEAQKSIAEPQKIAPINLMNLFKKRDVSIQIESQQTALHETPKLAASVKEEVKSEAVTIGAQIKAWASNVKISQIPIISRVFPAKTSAPMISQPAAIPAAVVANQVNTQNLGADDVAKSENASIVMSDITDGEQTGTPEADSVVNEVAQPLAVEAFDWKHVISDAELSTLAYEGFSGSATARWGVVRAANHWSTLTFKRFNGSSSVPMLSKNTILLLSNLAREQQVETTGLVFGRVPKGWNVELSEHRNQAIYVTEDKKAFFEKTYTSEVSNSQDRYFVFLNAAPGTKLLYLTQPGSKATAVVPIPVQSTQATYLDLPKPEKKTLSLHFRDASRAEQKSVGNLTVWPEGQSEHHTVKADSLGRGVLSNVYTLPGHALIIDAVSSSGVTHRYSVSDRAIRGIGGTKPKEIDLYVFNYKQIQGWKNQLEGGLSSQSGLVIAAYPNFTQNELMDKRFPTLSPVNLGGTLIPETYTLSSKETLEVKSPLEVGVPRSLSVHVPSGPMVLELQRDGGSPAWSQIIYSSPDVVNVVIAE